MFRAHRHPAIALLLVTLCGGCVSPRPGDGEPVVFGVVGPLRTSLGESLLLGARLAAAEVNADDGIHGRRLELLERDDGGAPGTSLHVVQGFVDDPRVVAVVGPANSANAVAVAPLVDRRVLSVATATTSPAISATGPWTMRIASSDVHNAAVLARHVRATTARAALLYSNDDFGRGLSDAFATAFRGVGGTLIRSDPYARGMEDFGPYLERLKRDSVQVVLIAGLDAEARRIITQARRLGIGARFIGSSALERLAGGGPDFEGTTVGMLFHPGATAEGRGFAERFRAAYGREPDSFSATAYDAVQLLARSAREAGAERASIQRYAISVGQPGGAAPHAGATGTLRFDAGGDPIDKAYVVGVIRDGRLRIEQERAR